MAGVQHGGAWAQTLIASGCCWLAEGFRLLATSPPTSWQAFCLRATVSAGELFAIGAPTSRWVVPAFSLCSVLLLAFAVGVWRAAGSRRLVRAPAVMFAGTSLRRGWARPNGLPSMRTRRGSGVGTRVVEERATSL